jgi:hypothetical protein
VGSQCAGNCTLRFDWGELAICGSTVPDMWHIPASYVAENAVKEARSIV